MTIQQKISEVRKQGYIIDIEIDFKLKYHKNKLKLIVRHNGRKLKELKGRYSNKNFGPQVEKKYLEIWDKIHAPKKIYETKKSA